MWRRSGKTRNTKRKTIYMLSKRSKRSKTTKTIKNYQNYQKLSKLPKTTKTIRNVQIAKGETTKTDTAAAHPKARSSARGGRAAGLRRVSAGTAPAGRFVLMFICRWLALCLICLYCSSLLLFVVCPSCRTMLCKRSRRRSFSSGETSACRPSTSVSAYVYLGHYWISLHNWIGVWRCCRFKRGLALLKMMMTAGRPFVDTHMSASLGSSSSSSRGEGIRGCPRCRPRNCWKTLRGNWSTGFLDYILPTAPGGFQKFSEMSVRTKQASCRSSWKTVFSRLLP